MNKCHLYKIYFTTEMEPGKKMPNKRLLLNKLNKSLMKLPDNPLVEYLGALSLELVPQKLYSGKRQLHWNLEVLGMLPEEEEPECLEEEQIALEESENDKKVPPFITMLMQGNTDGEMQAPQPFAEDQNFDDMVVPMLLNKLGELLNVPKEVKVDVEALPLTEELKAQVDNKPAYRRDAKRATDGEEVEEANYSNSMVLHRNSNPKEAMAELQGMIGIKAVKQKLMEIFATAKIAVERKKLGMGKMPIALHMLFTGNPGSAKTSVARLLGPILAGMGVVKTPKVVECTRADLVDKYVGWTAKKVKKMFFKARGGILFIDEAYSLVGSDKDFGPEAITAIVSEMENHRDDVIVIFAGYPKKMEEFLNNNEGLRSRITFRLDFPDYSAEELTAIVQHMAAKYDYVLSEGAQKKCQALAEKARQAENFGNGRFARNLLETAVMRQAVRLSGKTVTPKEFTVLTEEDFVSTELNLPKEKKTNPIGIVA